AILRARPPARCEVATPALETEISQEINQCCCLCMFVRDPDRPHYKCSSLNHTPSGTVPIICVPETYSDTITVTQGNKMDVYSISLHRSSGFSDHF
ncbi:hypothetical protein PO909_020852, partial [Leuciscus waleckii]